jgi:hypothetical protein
MFMYRERGADRRALVSEDNTYDKDECLRLQSLLRSVKTENRWIYA